MKKEEPLWDVWETFDIENPELPHRFIVGKTYKNHLGHTGMEVWGVGLTSESAMEDALARNKDTGFRCFRK